MLPTPILLSLAVQPWDPFPALPLTVATFLHPTPSLCPQCPQSCPAAARQSPPGSSQHLCLRFCLEASQGLGCCEHDARVQVLTFPRISLFQSLSYFSLSSCCFQASLLPFLLPVCFPWQHQMYFFSERICDLDSLPPAWRLGWCQRPPWTSRTGLCSPAAWLQPELCPWPRERASLARHESSMPTQPCPPDSAALKPLGWVGPWLGWTLLYHQSLPCLGASGVDQPTKSALGSGRALWSPYSNLMLLNSED